MHQFTAFTTKKDWLSLHDQNVSDMWQNYVPTLAFEHQFLLNAIISIAALHLTKIQPERQDMADTHRTYFNAAISQHRRAVREISPYNAEAVLISAVLIALPAFILLQNTEVISYSPPLQLFYILAGNVPIFRQGLPLVSPSSKIMCILTAKPNIAEFLDEASHNIYLEPFTQLLTWKATDETVDTESQNAYEFALGFIGCVLSRIESGQTDTSQIRRLIYTFPTVVGPVFVERLSEGIPRAMVILAYFFSLAKAVDNVWWMRGIAEREVFGIQSKLPEEWQWAMAWPLQKLAGFAAFTVQTRQAEVQRMVPSWRCQLVAAERSRANGSAILDT
jgi:hypothetical protein